jgi:hypothetical protein
MQLRSAYPVAQVVQQMATTSRRNRRPQHKFQIRHKPWDIQPFCIAPVQAGETMTMALYQSRVVTDPIKSPLIGWWTEYYWFYVKLRDLDQRDILTEMMLDPAQPTTGLNSAANVKNYHAAAAPDFTAMCLKRVVEEYFRDEGEAYNASGSVIGGVPIAKAIGPRANWLDSVELDSVLQARGDNGLQNPDTNIEYSKYQEAYDRMRQARMIDMSFDEWLETFGVRMRTDEQQHIPELLRMHRDWQYPSNTVEATTGVPSSAVSWAVSDRLDKDRYFREPGFILGVSVARPKIYMSGQKGSAVEMLNNAEAWLPALLGDQPWTSLRKYLGTEGPLAGLGASPAGDYWVDLRDLFLYGDQFVNFALTETDAGLVALPKAGMNKHYVNEADRTGLFVDATGVKALVRQDGVVNFTIKGSPLTTVDHT